MHIVVATVVDGVGEVLIARSDAGVDTNGDGGLVVDEENDWSSQKEAQVIQNLANKCELFASVAHGCIFGFGR